jgi:hypothetical protein
MLPRALAEVMIFDKVLTDAEIAYYMELTGKDVEVVTEPPATNPPRDRTRNRQAEGHEKNRRNPEARRYKGRWNQAG